MLTASCFAPSVTESSTVLTCSICGCKYTLPFAVERQRRFDGGIFQCPYGHQQYFPQVNHVSTGPDTQRTTVQEQRFACPYGSTQVSSTDAPVGVDVDPNDLKRRIEEQARRLAKARDCFREQIARLHDLQRENCTLREEYRKSRRQIGGIAGDRNAFKQQALGAMEEVKHLRNEIQQLTKELERLKKTLSAVDPKLVHDRVMALEVEEQRTRRRVIEELLGKVKAHGAPKGISAVRLENYLRKLCDAEQE